MSPKFKSWLALAAIFIAGILTGAALSVALGPYWQKPPAPRDMRQHLMTRLTESLKLTSDQQAKIQPIVTDATTQIQALHRDEMERGRQIFKSIDDQISTFLTSEQKAALQKMESEREKQFQGHMHHHGGSDEPGGMPPPPPGPAPNAPPAAP
jgi:Spy/CpxP family protein refolding chaperone